MTIGELRRITVTPTLDTAAYAAGDQISTLQTINRALSPHGGEIILITVLDKAAQSNPLDLFFFKSTVTVAADNAAFTITDAHMLECIGVVNILAADYDAVGSASSFATVQLKFPIMFSNGSDKMFMAIVARTSGPDYDADSLVFSFVTEGRD